MATTKGSISPESSPEPEYSEFERLWIAACAVYPVLRWPLTVQLGRALADGTDWPKPDLDAHVPLARHPWFRSGIIPADVRKAMLDELPSADQNRIRAIYTDLLARNDKHEKTDHLISHKDDPVFTRFMLGERSGPREQALDGRLWRALPIDPRNLDLRTLLVAFAALTISLAAFFSVSSLTENWQEAGEPSGDAVPLPEMVALPGGEFLMGSPDGVGDSDEHPQHQVTISPFAMAKYEVTFAQYQTFVEATRYEMKGTCIAWDLEARATKAVPVDASTGLYPIPTSDVAPYGPAHPAVCVSWNDAQAYLDWLNLVSGLAEKPDKFRLPTEAEWEYAARAGSPGDWYWSDVTNGGEEDHCGYVNGADSSLQQSGVGGAGWLYMSCEDGNTLTSGVGTYRPNAFGLHDMSGNVSEWVEDVYVDGYQTTPRDGVAYAPQPLPEGHLRVLRGGSWNYNPQYLRSANRLRNLPGYRIFYVGFRPARTLLTP